MISQLFSFLFILLFCPILQIGSDTVSRNTSVPQSRPNIILVMSDDQGYGEVGYYNHPILKTPQLDVMSRSGLRLDRFYAGAPVCSPTRSSVLTGRTNDRSAVYTVGYPMRLQEKTIAHVLQNAGYHTAHFGKWHLDGIKGAGVPVLKSDRYNPGSFGFDDWLSSTNYFDENPLLSRNGVFETFKGNASEILVVEALKQLKAQQRKGKPVFFVIWLSSPHSPWVADKKYTKDFEQLDPITANHYGEIIEVDHAIGQLRKGLRDQGIAENTLLWFNSDNGGVKDFGSIVSGGLRGFKGDVYEGGIRVPCIIEWPGKILPRVSSFPSVTMDIYPTIMDILGFPIESDGYPMDGMSLKPLFTEEISERRKPIGFRYQGKAAWVDGYIKLVKPKSRGYDFELYNLSNDPFEKVDLFKTQLSIAANYLDAFQQWNQSVERSISGNDYKEGLIFHDPAPVFWKDHDFYKPYMSVFQSRPEYNRPISEN